MESSAEERPALEVKPSPRSRMFFLDVLRTIAILLVLGRHLKYNLPQTDMSSPLVLLLRLWSRAGWIGVDLFFVLSGFLVSSLLMREYIRYGSVNVRRFLIRRAAKIYPAFYFFLFTVLVLRWASGNARSGIEVFAQVAFLQNYLPNFIVHTWSLAVEEHFYLLLALFVAIGVRMAPARAFRALPAAFVIVAIGLLALRMWTVSMVKPYAFETHLYPTHLRIDSLFFGVLLSYVYHFHRQFFTVVFLGRYRRWVLALSMVMIVPAAMFSIEASPFMQTAGLTLLYVGFGGIMAAGMDLQEEHFRAISPVTRLMAFIGLYSYSIYLWHLEVQMWVEKGYRALVGSPPAAGILFFLYVPASLACGIVLSKLIEFPVLRIRDRLYPSRSAVTTGIA